MEKKRRSIVKAISWRFFATLITAAIVWIMTGELKFAATVGLIDTLVKFVIYFLHERIWNKIPYGRIRQPEYQI